MRHGLGQIAADAGLVERGDVGLEISVSCEHQLFGGRTDFPGLYEKLHAVHFRELAIGDNVVGGLGFQFCEGIAGQGGLARVEFPAQHGLEQILNTRLPVHHQYPWFARPGGGGSAGRGPGAGC
ncbi:MAG: hypothetical protein O7A69_02970 [SAR324 cluster bacterium]|nr:hypothetical protein [SAR324 cluster bacterium]